MEILLSVIIASATVIYTVVTVFQLVESRKNRLLKEAPNIIAFLKTTEDHTVLSLYINNYGDGVAKNVAISFKKDFNRFSKEGYRFSKIGIAQHGMNFFPPQYQLKFDVGFVDDIFQNSKEDYIELEIRYQNLQNRSFQTFFKLPFNQVFGQTYSNPPETYLGQISHYLKEINSTLNNTNKQLKQK